MLHSAAARDPPRGGMPRHGAIFAADPNGDAAAKEAYDAARKEMAAFDEEVEDALLRHPAFLRMRPDKSPRDCERQFTTETTEFFVI